jgi:hypothetical protein
MNAGPMYIQDYCRFVTSYRNKFKRPLLINNTALSDVIIIRNLNWPPRDIYGQRALMDVASARHSTDRIILSLALTLTSKGNSASLSNLSLNISLPTIARIVS